MLTSESIMQVAFKMFAENGYFGTSISKIANKVGVTKAGIYAHFKSKEELFITVIDREVTDCFLRLDKLSERYIKDFNNKTTREVLYEYFRATFEYANKDYETMRFWASLMFFPTSSFEDMIGDKISSFKEKHYYIQKSIFEHGIASGEIEDLGLENLVYTFSSMVEGNMAMILNSKHVSIDKVQLSFDMYWKSIERR